MKHSNLFNDFDPISKEDWRAKIEKDLKGKPYGDLCSNNAVGIPIEPIYHTEDTIDVPSAARGSKAINNDWVITETINLTGQGSEDNKNILHLLNKGLNGITLKGNPDLNTLQEIELEYITTGFIDYDSPVDVAHLLLEKVGTASNTYSIHLNYDPIGQAALNGGWNTDKHSDLALGKTVVQQLSSFKNARTFAVNAHTYHNCGGNAVSELAFALAHAHEYLCYLMEQGYSIDDASAQIKINLASGADYFLELAKFRAIRLLWSKMIEAYQPQHGCSTSLLVQGYTSQFTSTVYDAHNNMLRATTQSMSAVLGGCDVLEVLPYDTAWSEGNHFSHRIARNIQLLLKEESYLDKVIDPAGGSYYIEYLTQELAKMAWAKFQKIEHKGGFIGLMDSGNLHRELSEDAHKQIKSFNQGETKVLGVNLYPNDQETALDKLQETSDGETIETDFAPIQPLRLVGEFEQTKLMSELKEEGQ